MLDAHAQFLLANLQPSFELLNLPLVHEVPRKKDRGLSPFHKKPNRKKDHDHNDYDLNHTLNRHFVQPS